VKLWQAPARALPVTIRPLGGETAISYARRLAEANEMPATAIMRALGQLGRPSGYHLLEHDAWLNDQALDRLEAYSGISRTRLTRALPGLRRQRPGRPQLPAGRPALDIYQPWPRARQACRPCTLRASGTSGPPVMVLPQASPLICQRHERWLGTPGETAQYDLSLARDVLTAHRRYSRLLSASPDRKWAGNVFGAAWQITERWASTAVIRFPVLTRRWRTRARALGIPPAIHAPAVVTFPEAAMLAEILTDLNWRRHVAMVRPSDLGIFYQRIARRLGEKTYPSWSRSDPLLAWVDHHRGRFTGIRDKTWAQAILRSQPFPEIRHFK
jgi:hypothetical protein